MFLYPVEVVVELLDQLVQPAQLVCLVHKVQLEQLVQQE
jgi:hypothetical protein